MSHGFLTSRSGATVLGLLLSSLFSCCSSQKPPGFPGLCLPAYPTFTQPPGSSNTGSASKIPPESSPPLMPSTAPARAFIIFSWAACRGILVSSPCLSSHPLPKRHSPHSCRNPIALLLHVKPFDYPPRGHPFSRGTRGPAGLGFLLPPQGCSSAAISSDSFNVSCCFTSLSYSSFCLEYPLPDPTPTPGLQSPSPPPRLSAVTTSCVCDTFPNLPSQGHEAFLLGPAHQSSGY